MKTGNKKSKTTYLTLTISRETIEDCLSSWLTATGFIGKDQFVSLVIPSTAWLADGDHVQDYKVRIVNGKEKEEIEEEAEDKAKHG